MSLFITLGNTFSYSYRSTFVSLNNYKYSYTRANDFNTSAYVTYTFTGSEASENYKIIGYRSDYTQVIANSLQYWNRIRNCQNSTGQLFINSMASFIEEATRYWSVEKKELWLATADINQPYNIPRIPLPNHIDLNRTLNKNKLVNGGFTYNSLAKFKLPMYWNTKFSYSNGSITKYLGDSVIGNGCVKLSASQGQRCYLSQSHNYLYPKGSYLTASIWYKTPVLSDYNSIESNSNCKLKLIVTYNDGTSDVFSKVLKSGTSLRWIKETLTISPTKDIGRIEYAIDLYNSSSSYTKTFYIDAAMLEEGDHASQFEPFIADQLPDVKLYDEFFRSPTSVEMWGSSSNTTGNSISGYYVTGSETPKISLYPINSKELFISNALSPTRVSVTTGVSNYVGVTNTIYGIYPSPYDSTREKGFFISNNTGFYTYQWPFTDDNTGSFLIAEPNLHQTNIKTESINNVLDLYDRYTIPQLDPIISGSYSILLEAFTIKDDKIWLITKETYLGNTERVLKVVNPRTEIDKSYFELIKDFTLSGLTTNGGVTSVGFVTNEPNKILITLTGNSVTSGNIVNLYYDYYWIDNNRRQVFTREQYSGYTAIIF